MKQKKYHIFLVFNDIKRFCLFLLGYRVSGKGKQTGDTLNNCI